jgi:hypothetical protein
MWHFADVLGGAGYDWTFSNSGGSSGSALVESSVYCH